MNQKPDTKLPKTSNIHQIELEIPRPSLCFDINQGCIWPVIGLDTRQTTMGIKIGMEKYFLAISDAYLGVFNTDHRDLMPLFVGGTAAARLRADNSDDAFALG